jgi:hypothetical protein
MNLLKYSLYSLLIGLILFLCGELINSQTDRHFFIAQYPYFIMFFYLVGLAAFAISAWGLKKSSDSSVFIVLASVMAKLLLSMVFALIFIYGKRFDKIAFLLSFFLPYFIYSTFEIYTLLYNLRALKK